MAKKKVSAKSAQADVVYKLHVSLPETTPLVWRRILVPGDFTLEALHSVIQLTMGWQMSHLYDFQIGKLRYSEKSEYDESPVHPITATLNSALKTDTAFIYNYDFGDSWLHRIGVEGIVPREGHYHYPICIGGENACPPEDCGSFPGFDQLKQTIADPNCEDYEHMMTWLGGYFDPCSFDPNRINRDLLWATDWKSGPNEQGLYHPFNFNCDD